MVKLNQVYKCEICGNITEILHVGGGELICCGQSMDLKNENTEDAAEEKHVPVLEKIKKGAKVTVGSVAHPMSNDHYIEWIEVIGKKRLCRKNLKPGDKPFAEFCLDNDDIEARAYCNLHGLWKF